MSWKEQMKEFGGGDLAFLSEDGETLKFIVIEEPVLLEGLYKGTASRKVGCPVITDDGFMLFVVGMRLARKIAKHEDEFDKSVFMAVRHGIENDANATYELKVLDEPELLGRLVDIRENDYKPDMLTEAIKAAKEVMAK